jgi:hypothetical protein
MFELSIGMIAPRHPRHLGILVSTRACGNGTALPDPARGERGRDPQQSGCAHLAWIQDAVGRRNQVAHFRGTIVRGDLLTLVPKKILAVFETHTGRP